MTTTKTIVKPETAPLWELDAWEFMGETDMIVRETTEGDHVVIEHRVWTHEDWEQFEKLYQRTGQRVAL